PCLQRTRPYRAEMLQTQSGRRDVRRHSGGALPNEVQLGGTRALRGRLRVPGDKSISHRALLFAALADGPSRLSHLATGDDVGATRRAIEALGVRVKDGRDGALTVRGAGVDGLREPDDVLDCGNSG